MTLPKSLFAPHIAHRGLWRADGPPENSLSAFDAACKAGFGIELDVFLSADGEAMVFHDDSLERMTGTQGRVWELTAKDLTVLRLRGGPERIPTLAETLDLVAGRAMVLVEIKASPAVGGPLETRVAEVLDHYDGQAAVISFEPRALAWFAAHRPDRPRGLDAMNLYEPEGAATFEQACALAEPDFLALELTAAMSETAIRRRSAGQPVIAWTVRSAVDVVRMASYCDNFIFEGFTA